MNSICNLSRGHEIYITASSWNRPELFTMKLIMKSIMKQIMRGKGYKGLAKSCQASF